MLTTLLAICLSALVATSAYAGELYSEHRNPRPDAGPAYNPHEDRWETVQGDKNLRYNPHEDEWSYEDMDADLQYNPHEDRWEYPK